MNSFEKIFEKLVRQYDPSVIFNNWLDWSIDANLLTLKKYNHDFHGFEQQYYEMFTSWITLTHEYFNANQSKQWFDYLGKFYEDIIQSKYSAGAKGQFFTPHDVCQTMADLLIPDDILGRLNDPTCGSGRLLLAGHVNSPYSICIGQDMDSTACKMAVLNFYLHGVRGSILCMNTLSNEFFEAWRVNNYLGYGLSVPHIEYVSESEAYRFIGDRIIDDEVVVNEEVVLDVPKQSKQVSLEAFM